MVKIVNIVAPPSSRTPSATPPSSRTRRARRTNYIMSTIPEDNTLQSKMKTGDFVQFKNKSDDSAYTNLGVITNVTNTKNPNSTSKSYTVKYVDETSGTLKQKKMSQSKANNKLMTYLWKTIKDVNIIPNNKLFNTLRAEQKTLAALEKMPEVNGGRRKTKRRRRRHY